MLFGSQGNALKIKKIYLTQPQSQMFKKALTESHPEYRKRLRAEIRLRQDVRGKLFATLNKEYYNPEVSNKELTLKIDKEWEVIQECWRHIQLSSNAEKR